MNHFSIIAKSKGLHWKNLNKFATLQKELGVSLDELHDLANKVLKFDIYTLDDILSILEVEVGEFQEIFLSANTKGMTKFKLRNRALHVLQGRHSSKRIYSLMLIKLLLSESIRVRKFCDLCRSNGSISELSKLMRRSHFSLDTNYECSHPKLNQLVQISNKFGVGARLTGAG